MYRLLIADDDSAVLQMVSVILEEEDYDVTSLSKVSDVLSLIEEEDFDLFLIDLAFSEKGDMNGLALCDHLRQNPRTADTPIIFLTGQQDIDTAVKALETGADDYIRKPFAVKELTARIRAHLRRANLSEQFNAQMRINPDTCKVIVDDREVALTRIEFDLLSYLIHAPKKWLTTQELLAGVWNYPDGVGDTALVRNHIRNLRRKVEYDADRPHIIQSRHGRGYSIFAQIEFDYAI